MINHHHRIKEEDEEEDKVETTKNFIASSESSSPTANSISRKKQTDRARSRTAIVMPKQHRTAAITDKKINANASVNKKKPKAAAISSKKTINNITKKSSRQKENASSLLATSVPAGNNNDTTTNGNIALTKQDFQQTLLAASLAQRQHRQSDVTKIQDDTCFQQTLLAASLAQRRQLKNTNNKKEGTTFQQRLLKASLAQRQQQQKDVTNQSDTIALSTKKEESIKHIRVLSQLYNNTKQVDAKLSTSPAPTTKLKKPQGTKTARESAKKLVRKAAAAGKIYSNKEDAKKRSNKTQFAVKAAANLNATTTRRQVTKDDVQPKAKKLQNGKPIKPSLPPREGPEKMRRQQSQFQQRLLRASLAAEAKSKVLVAQQREDFILREQRLLSERKDYDFHRRLLEQKNTYEMEDIERNESQRILEERLAQEKKDKGAKRKQDFLLHQSLLEAKYHYIERANLFKMKRLVRDILQLKENKRKQNDYQFQKRRLASSLKSMKKQKEQEKLGIEKQKQDKLNSLLQNFRLMNYTKKKIGEKAKFKFQRKLLEAAIENARIARRREKKKEAEKLKLKLQKGLMEQRLRSQAKADAKKREAEAKIEFQMNLIQLYSHMATRSKYEIRQKQKTDFQQELLTARVRYDLVARKRLAEKRINELHKSLLDAQRESELAAAQVLEAEERKRQAQLELEERQKREEEEKEAERIEAEQRVQQQIKESREREEAVRKEFENAGRQQSTTDSSSGNGMNEYEAILELQRKEAIQRREDEGRRKQEELQRMMENAGRTEASEQTMDRYAEILEQQKNEELQRQQAEAQRRQETLRRQLEETGRQQAQAETASTMDEYSQWVEQAKQSWQPPLSTTTPETVVPTQLDAVTMDTQSSPTLQPEQASTTDFAAPQEVIQTQEQHQQEVQQQDQQQIDPLVGTVLLDKFLVAEKLRVGGDRSELYKCYHVLDKPQEFALVIKLSHNIQQIELEHRIYGDLFSRLSPERQELFVRAYDWVPASEQTNGRVGFAMECGLENLRGHIWRHGPYTGEKLRSSMENVIRIVQALHGLGVVWSELKAENFIVFDGDKIKAVDLESVAAHNEFLRAYTAETYPPEFPADSLYECLPKIPVDYSFDVWGMGLSLYELAVGEPLFTLQRTYDVDYIKERLKNPEGIVDEANKKMWKVESGARNIIRKCLVVDPTKRSSCDELLQDPYFANANQRPPTAFSPSAMGTSSFK
ncbi:MAG: hypothetical protein SGBAC_003099 [Bacillariaceae sp.]